MKDEKEARRLDIEELERRAAPMVLVDVEQEEPTEPTGSDDSSLPSGGGDGAGDGSAPAADQPGNSDGHRSKIWQKSE